MEDVGMKVERALQMFDRQFTDTLLTHFCYYRSRLSTDGRLMIGQYSDRYLTNTRRILHQYSTHTPPKYWPICRPTLNWYSADAWPIQSVYRPICRSTPHISHKICRSYSLYEFVILTQMVAMKGLSRHFLFHVIRKSANKWYLMCMCINLTVMNTCNRPMGVHLIKVFTVQIQTWNSSFQASNKARSNFASSYSVLKEINQEDSVPPTSLRSNSLKTDSVML